MRDSRLDFEEHWRYKLESVSPAKLIEAESFLHPLLDKLRSETNKLTILDAGCGDGIHGLILQEQVCHYMGLDLSENAVQTAQLRLGQSSSSDLVVGDTLKLPYADNSFDVVFSYGVVAYTANPLQAIAEFARICKPGGLIGVWIYPQPQGILKLLLNMTRFLAQLFGRRLARLLLVYPIVPLLPILPVQSGVSLKNSSWQQCVEVVEVNIMPQQLIFPSLAEVKSWYEKSKITIEINDESRPISIWGKKSAQ